MNDDTIRLSEPCTMAWDAMKGDERVRFCTHCNLHVHNLSAMTDEEVEATLDARGEQRCVRMTSDTNGRLITLSTPSDRKRRWLVAAAVALPLAGCHTMGKPIPPRTAWMGGIGSSTHPAATNPTTSETVGELVERPRAGDSHE